MGLNCPCKNALGCVEFTNWGFVDNVPIGFIDISQNIGYVFPCCKPAT